MAGLVSCVLAMAACSSDDDASPDPTVTETPASEPASPETTPGVDTSAPTVPATAPPATAPPATEIPATEIPATAVPRPSVEIELLTYNVAGLPAALSGSEPDVNTVLIGARLNDYDVVLVQESWLTSPAMPEESRTFHEILVEQSDHPFASESLPAPLGSDPDRPTAQLSDGLNRFSDFAFGTVDREMWEMCGDASADCLALKGFSVSTVTFADGVDVDVYNLHLDAGREDSAIRADNVAQLSAHIVANDSGNAIVVAGDFNLHLDRQPDDAQFADLLASTGLIDVCAELDCPEPNRIDKVLVRSSDRVGITPVEWRNEAPAFTRDDGAPLSDHDPVVARLRIDARSDV